MVLNLRFTTDVLHEAWPSVLRKPIRRAELKQRAEKEESLNVTPLGRETKGSVNTSSPTLGPEAYIEGQEFSCLSSPGQGVFSPSLARPCLHFTRISKVV